MSIQFQHEFPEKVYKVTVTLTFKDNEVCRIKTAKNFVKSPEKPLDSVEFSKVLKDFMGVDDDKNAQFVISISEHPKNHDKQYIYENMFALLRSDIAAEKSLNSNLEGFVKLARWFATVALDHTNFDDTKEILKENKMLCEHLRYILESTKK